MADNNVSMLSVLFYAAFIGWTWVLNYTVFLPVFLLLSHCGHLRSRFFSFFLTQVIRRFFANIEELRKKLFEIINERLKPGELENPLRILEIGVGDGMFFPYYPENCTLTLLDNNPNFLPYMKEKLKEFPRLRIENIITASADDMKDIDDNSFDLVISSHFLCSVADVDGVVREVYRVLKPGGLYCFIDHVAYIEKPVVHCLQRWISPIGKIYLDGCCVDRDIVSMVGKHFNNISPNMFYLKEMPLLAQAHVIGLATK